MRTEIKTIKTIIYEEDDYVEYKNGPVNEFGTIVGSEKRVIKGSEITIYEINNALVTYNIWIPEDEIVGLSTKKMALEARKARGY